MITKTDYVHYRECAKDVWFRIHKPDLYYSKPLSAFAEALIETGNEVELVARQLFPDGVLIEGRDDEALAETAKLVELRVPKIFQAVFAQDGYFAVTDILQWEAATESFVLSEVKATSKAKAKEHFPDLAFQVNLLRRCGLRISRIQLVHLNSEYVRSGALNLHELFETEDVTEPVSAMLEEVAADMEQAKLYLSAAEEPVGTCTCIYKGRSKHCTMFTHINPDVPEYSVHDIARIGISKKKLQDLVDTGVYLLDDIPEDFQLTGIQRNQVGVHKLGRPLVQQGAIQAELEKLVFPLYFLDYETYPCAIPRFDGFSPYQQIPFQFSLHVVDTPDREPIHHGFLFTGSGDPSSEFLTALSTAIGAAGSVLVWNKTFECGINSKLATRIADGRAFLEDLNNRVFDYVVAGEQANLLRFNMPLNRPEDAEGLKGLKQGEEFWRWCEANGYRHILDQHSYRNLIFGLLSDMCHFIYEGLKCSEKSKLSVTFALLRKPLQDNLFYLEWLLADWPDFLQRFKQGPDQLDPSKLEPEARKARRVGCIANAMDKTSMQRWLDPEWLYEIRYEKASEIGLDPYFNHGLHLVTTFKYYATTPENINFIFCNEEDNEHLWLRLYSMLPLVLMHALHVVRALFKSFAPDFKLHDPLTDFWLTTGLVLWAEEMSEDKPIGEATAALNDSLRQAQFSCPKCGTKLNFGVENVRCFWWRGELQCSECDLILTLYEPSHAVHP